MLWSSFKILFQKDMKLLFSGSSMFGYALGMVVVMCLSVTLPMSKITVSEVTVSTLIWIILFFSCSEVSQRIFLDEETKKTADLIRQIVPSSVIYLSKVVSVSIFISIISITASALLVFWFKMSLNVLPVLLLVMIIGSFALGISQGIISYMIARGSARGSVFAIVAIPIILPVLISLINITTQVLEFKPISITLVIVVMAQSLAILITGILFLPYLEKGV
ncbi:MAG: heme exporter protein CcmB [Caldisericia bacterium]